MINFVDRTMADNPADRQEVERLKKMVYADNGQINKNLSLEKLKEIKNKIFLLEKDFAKKRIITDDEVIVGYALTDLDAELAVLQDEFEDYLLNREGGNLDIDKDERGDVAVMADEEYEILFGYREAVIERLHKTGGSN